MKMKARMGAMLAAAIMSFSLAVPALAAVPAADTTAEITVENVKNTGVTVKAYQVVEGTYNSYGLTGYKAVTGVSIADIENPTADEVTTTAAGITSGTITATSYDLSSTDGSTYTAAVPAGSYVVVITGGTDTIYNPILMGVYYTDAQDDTKIAAGTVDAEGNFVYKAENGDGDLEDVTAYVKSDLIPGDKTITSEDAVTDYGSDFAIGDTVPFEIVTAFPSYADNYTEVVFNVTDTFSEGLTNKEDVVITITGADGTEVSATEDTDYTIVYGTDPTIKIEFDSDFVLENGGADVEITYSAIINDDAALNLNPNTNGFVIEFTNGPDGTSDDIEGKTYQYTFAIDGKIMGTNEEVEKELVKVSLDENGDPVYEETEGETTTSYYPLAGATFKLTNSATGQVYYATTDSDGLFGPATVGGTEYPGFVGLDAGDYTFIETVAPTGYAVDGQTHTVKIETEFYDADVLEEGTIVAHKGELKNYTLTIDGLKQQYTATYEGGTVTEFTQTDEDAFAVIKNTKLSKLPSTGGMGSYVFTIAGVVVMAGAAGIFFMNRRKDEQK